MLRVLTSSVSYKGNLRRRSTESNPFSVERPQVSFSKISIVSTYHKVAYTLTVTPYGVVDLYFGSFGSLFIVG